MGRAAGILRYLGRALRLRFPANRLQPAYLRLARRLSLHTARVSGRHAAGPLRQLPRVERAAAGPGRGGPGSGAGAAASPGLDAHRLPHVLLVHVGHGLRDGHYPDAAGGGGRAAGLARAHQRGAAGMVRPGANQHHHHRGAERDCAAAAGLAAAGAAGVQLARWPPPRRRCLGRAAGQRGHWRAGGGAGPRQLGAPVRPLEPGPGPPAARRAGRPALRHRILFGFSEQARARAGPAAAGGAAGAAAGARAAGDRSGFGCRWAAGWQYCC